MQFRDLFGDGDVSGDLDRKACLSLSCNWKECCETCSCRDSAESECGKTGWGGQRVIEIAQDAVGLPREAVRAALLDGADIVLNFSKGAALSERMLQEVAHLLRRLRSAGTSVALHGLANTVRARIARQEASLGRP